MDLFAGFLFFCHTFRITDEGVEPDESSLPPTAPLPLCQTPSTPLGKEMNALTMAETFLSRWMALENRKSSAGARFFCQGPGAARRHPHAPLVHKKVGMSLISILYQYAR